MPPVVVIKCEAKICMRLSPSFSLSLFVHAQTFDIALYCQKAMQMTFEACFDSSKVFNFASKYIHERLVYIAALTWGIFYVYRITKWED